MTIRRQYSLPNCTLLLEGLSDGTPGNPMDARPLMTILVNAECHFTGQPQRLSGGRDFFESLVHSVSRYAQEFLSQMHHPKLPGDKPELVQLHKLTDRNLHRLMVLPAPVEVPVGGGKMFPNAQGYFQPQQGTLDMELTTVQLFDLVEAIDQFLADRQTLPDLGVTLQPLPRRYRKADQPLAKRAAPAAVGLTGLTVAAIAFMLVPVPQVRQPKPVQSQANVTKTATPSPSLPLTTTPTPTTTTSPTASPLASDVEKALTSAEITDPTQLKLLQRKLYSKLDDSWKERRQISENLEYRVAVGQDGAIIGYKSVNEAAGGDASRKTPLPDLLYKPTAGSIASSEPLAQYRVVFNNRGVLQISPWRGFTDKPSLGPEITDGEKINKLNTQLYEQIRKEWTNKPIYQKDLIYRVAVTEDGVIADYEPNNQPASDYVKETPLERLLKPDAAKQDPKKAGALPEQPLAQYRVVFKQDGALEVSPLQSPR
jgi:Domain of unknown function (DUF4335)